MSTEQAEQQEQRRALQKFKDDLDRPEDEEAKIVRRNAFFEKFLRMYKKIFYEIQKESTTRTRFCKHKIASCYMHALEGFIKDFFYGATVKSGVLLAFSLLSPKKKLAGGLKQIFTFDTALFGIFSGGFIAVYRLLLCKLRAVRNKEDKLNSMIAGFCAALVLAVDRSKSRRITVAIYSFARCLETFIK